MADIKQMKINGRTYDINVPDGKITTDKLSAESVTKAKLGEDVIADFTTLRHAVGTPLVAATAAAMTDTAKIYVYVGSEDGYTNGNWYYYNGSAWASGGAYNDTALETDTTLLVSGAAADAKVTGQVRDATIPSAWDDQTNYNVNDLVWKNNKLYKCIKSGAGTWSGAYFTQTKVPSEITALLNGKDIDWSANRLYVAGDFVRKSDKLYLCFRDIPSAGTWSGNNFVEFVKSFNGGRSAFVSPSGSDDGAGTAGSPFKTVGKAISEGFKTIILASGVYDEKISLSGLSDISIICRGYGSQTVIDDSQERRAHAVFSNGVELTGLAAYENIYSAAYVASSDSYIYKVFISHAVDPVYSGTHYGAKTAYNAVLWEDDGTASGATYLAPVLTLSACQEQEGTFYYDGTKIYVHPTDGIITGKTYHTLRDDSLDSCGVTVESCRNLYIEGIDVDYYSNQGVSISQSVAVSLNDCRVMHTCYDNCFNIGSSDARLSNCTAIAAGSDGFGCRSTGNVDLINCVADNCQDDGASHHDSCTGVIDGGLFTNCMSGGIAPAYGSRVNVQNVASTHNTYGIRYIANNERKTNMPLCLSASLFADNDTSDIYSNKYNVISYGCVYQTKNIVSGTFSEYGNTVLAD